jgi:hypothetical protein
MARILLRKYRSMSERIGVMADSNVRTFLSQRIPN